MAKTKQTDIPQHFTVVEAAAPFPCMRGRNMFCVADDCGDPMSDEAIADELEIKGTLHSRQVKVVEIMRSIVPVTMSHVYVSDNGPAHIMVDEYFASKPGCQKVADELNRRYADMVAKQEKRNGKGTH